jgi:lipopolysaccharide export system protein LptA
MKIYRYNRPGFFSIILIAVTALLLTGPYFSAQAAESGSQARGEPIRITADKLVIDNKGNSAVFTGHVQAVQGSTEMTADQLTLYYRNSKQPKAENRANNIEKIHAQGHVRIVFDNRVAVSDQAVYTTDNRKIVLTGPGSQIVDDKNVITGDEIIFLRDQGQVEVNKKGNDQVKAVIQSGEKGLN